MHTIQIKNWVNFNGRGDVKSCSWYRQSNDFFSDPDFYQVDSISRTLWVFILCAASKKNEKGRVKINLNVFCDAVSTTLKEAKSSLKKLESMGCLVITDGEEKVRSCTVVENEVTSLQTDRQTDEHTNVRDEQKKHSPLLHLTASEKIKSWLGGGSFEVQAKLLDAYHPDYLSQVIESAYYWQQENTKRKAGTFLKGWVDRDSGPNKKPRIDPLVAFFESEGIQPCDMGKG